LPQARETQAPQPKPVIRHTLFEEEEQTLKPKMETEKPSFQPEIKTVEIPKAKIEIPFEGYIPTSELIKNMNVDCEEISIHHLAEFEQLVINEIDVNDFVIVEPKKKEIPQQNFSGKTEFSEREEQMLMFDLPVSSRSNRPDERKEEAEKKEKITHRLEDIDVNEHTEIIPVTEVSNDGIKKYSLDDYEEVENHFMNAKPTPKKVAEEEVAFERKIVHSPENEEFDDENVDPMNAPISKLLRERAEERKRKMKEFNYKFRNSNSKIDEIEKQPAYKRMGIELDESLPKESNLSRTSVNTDDDDLDMRSNNSFLHDNVD